MKVRERRILAMILCFAMILSGFSNLSLPVMAKETSSATVTDAEEENESAETVEQGEKQKESKKETKKETEKEKEASKSEETVKASDTDAKDASKKKSAKKNKDDEKDLEVEIDGIKVFVVDKKNVLPEGAYIEVEKLEDKDALKLAKEAAGKTEDNVELVRDAIGVDITFYDADDNKFEPSKDVEVNIDVKEYRKLEIEDKYTNPSYDVLHIPDKGDPEFIEDAKVDEEGAVFESDDFSPYIITASPIDLTKINAANVQAGFSDYSPYIKTHKLTVDNQEILDGDTIEPTKQFKLEMSFNMKLSDMSTNITDSTDGLHYYFPLPDHISIGDKGSADSQIPLYNSRNVQIGTYYIKADAKNGDVMYVTFPGFYDDVTTYFELSASWSDTDDKDSIQVPWGKDVDTYFINRTSLIITKDQTRARRGDDGITRNVFHITIKAKDDMNDVKDVDFKDEMTSQHFILDPEGVTGDDGKKYAFKITSYDKDGVVVGTPEVKPASVAKTSDAGTNGTKTSVEIKGLTVPKGGKIVVEYAAYIPREDKRDMDNNAESDTLENTAAASHPVTNKETGKVEHPWITSKVTDNLIYKKQWILKDASDKNLVKVTDTDNTEYIAMDYDVEVNPLREYTMGGALIRDVISNSFYSADDIKYTNVTYDIKNLANEKPYVTKTVKANTATTRELSWVPLSKDVYDDLCSKIDVKHPLGALGRLQNDSALAGTRSALQSAISAAGYSFSGDYSDYIFTDNECHEFVWLVPEDEDDPDRPGDKIVGTYKLHYHTISGLGVGSFANSASLRYRDMDPVIFGAVGYPGDYSLKDRKIEAKKYNEGVYLGNDGNYYVDWTITVAVPADSRGWEDIMLIDEFPRYVVGSGDDTIIYSDWLKGLAAPNYDSMNSGVFQFSTDSKRNDVKAIVNRARVGLDNGYWNGYSETMTSNYMNGYFVSVPDEEWIDKLSRWNAEAFVATIASKGTHYSGKDLAAGQFIAETDGTDWTSVVKKGDTGTINSYTIYLGDFPGTEDTEGYDVKIKYTTMVNPLLVERLPDILKDKGEDVAVLTNTADVFHSYVKRDGEGNILGRALMQGGTSEGWVGKLQSSYWIGGGDADDCIIKDKVSDYDGKTGLVSYKSSLNKNKQLIAHKNVYTIQDAMNVPGVLYKNINLKFPSDVNGGAAIITNGKVVDAYKNDVKIEVSSAKDSSNKLTITFDNAGGKFQDAAGKVAQLVLTYDVDFKSNSVPTDVTLNNSIVLSERMPNADGETFSTKLIDQAEVEYTIDKALDKTLDKDNLPSEKNNFTATYSIIVDPTSANAKELADMAVGDTFTVKDTMGSNMDLILKSVKVSMIEKGAATDITKDCQRSYNSTSRILQVKVPKKSATASYKIEYQVNVTHLSKDGETYLRNKAEILGTTVKKEDDNERISIFNSSESSDASTNMIRINKYDMDNISASVDATFDIYKYDNGWKCLTSGADKIYADDFPISTTNGKVVITNMIPDNQPHRLIEVDTWYKLVERSTSKGYTVNGEPLYYYVSVDGAVHKNAPSGVDNYVIANLITGKKESEIEEDALPTLLFGNKKTGLRVEKTDKGTGAVLKGVEFSLYKDADAKQLIEAQTTDDAGIAEFSSLTVLDANGSGTVYLKETATVPTHLIDENIYEITFENGNVTNAVSVSDSSKKLGIDTNGALSKVTVKDISVTNKLIIEKKVNSKSAKYKNDEFEFVINLTDADGKTLTGTFESHKFAADGTANPIAEPYKSGDTIKLKDGEKFEIDKLPTDTKYTVSERTPADYTPTIEVTDTVGGDRKKVYGSNTSGTVEQGSADDLLFNNTRRTSLIVTKSATKKSDKSALKIPDGHTVTIRSNNIHTGKIWAIAKYNATSEKYECEYLVDDAMKFYTTTEDGSDIVGGFRITGIDYTSNLAVVESNADIPGYSYKLVNADGYNANGVWATDSSDDRTLVLNNVYDELFADVNITAEKTLLGKTLEDEEFSFAIYQHDGSGYGRQIKAGVKNNQAGKIDFGRISYSLEDLGGADEKDIFYKIVEEKESRSEIVYDTTTAVYVKVHLHKEKDASTGEDVLKADAPVYSSTDMSDGSESDGKKPKFVNGYNASGKLALKISKKMLSKNASNGMFSFKVTEYSDATYKTEKSDMPSPLFTATSPAIAKDGSGEITFPEFTYAIVTNTSEGKVAINHKGMHYYLVEEIIPDAAEDLKLADGSTVKYLDGIIYDTTKYKIAVSVTDDGKGNLTPVVKKVESDGSIGDTVNESNFTTEYVFENKYYATGSIGLNASKKLTGRDMKAREFSFAITEYKDATRTDIKKDSNSKDIVYEAYAPAASDGDEVQVSFSDINYTLDDVGTHYYRIAEKQPSGMGVTTANGKNKKDGVTYSNEEYDFVVVVSDNGDGTLKTEVRDDSNKAITDTAAKFEFENVYSAEGSITFEGTKTVEGHDIINSAAGYGYEFIVKETGISNTYYGKTVKNATVDSKTGKAKAAIVFDTISYGLNDLGEHEYLIYEKITKQGLDGITYDTHAYTVTVKVEDGGNGSLKASITKIQKADSDTQIFTDMPLTTKLDFTNVYNAETSLTISATKSIKAGAKTLADSKTFEFELIEVDGDKEIVLATGTNDDNGDITFEDPANPGTEFKLSYKVDGANKVDAANKVGIHSYKIVEKDAGDSGYTYDNEVYTFRLNVTDNFDGTLHIEDMDKALTRTDGTTDAAADTRTYTLNIGNGKSTNFENGYEAKGDITFGGTKAFTVKETNTTRDMKDDEFTFTVTEYTDDTYTTEKGTTKYKGANKADGTITFDTIEYVRNESQDDVGTHYYRVVENIPDGAEKVTDENGNDSYIYKGVTYSNQSYDVTVNVSDNDDGTLTCTTSGIETKLDFANTYSAAGEIILEGQKSVTDIEKTYNKLEMTDGMFTFVVKDDSGKEVSTGKNDKDGKIVFGTIKYDMKDIGTHKYTITEASDKKVSGIIYDTSEIQAEVTVSDAGDGTLDVSVSYKKNNELINSAVFNNKTSEVKIKKTDENGAGLAGAKFKITTKDGTEVTSFESNGDIHVINGLEINTEYILVEVEAPEGYEKAKDVSFKIDEEGNVFVDGTKVDIIEIANEKIIVDSGEKDKKNKDAKSNKKNSKNSKKNSKKNATVTAEDDSNNNNKNNNSVSSQNHKTGDTMNLVLVMMLCMLSLLGMIYIGVKKYRSRSNN